MRLLASGRRRQAASLEEEVIGVLVVSVGLTLADLILRDRPDLNRLQGLSLKFDAYQTSPLTPSPYWLPS